MSAIFCENYVRCVWLKAIETIIIENKSRSKILKRTHKIGAYMKARMSKNKKRVFTIASS